VLPLRGHLEGGTCTPKLPWRNSMETFTALNHDHLGVQEFSGETKGDGPDSISAATVPSSFPQQTIFLRSPDAKRRGKVSHEKKHIDG